ncbi:MAG: hypothetical protein J6A04_00275 [Clostridia bacterium]|nr:hypothetical protein [Clostridia bacterium]
MKKPIIFVAGSSVLLNLSFEEQSELLETIEATSGYEEISDGVFLISDNSLIKHLQNVKAGASL